MYIYYCHFSGIQCMHKWQWAQIEGQEIPFTPKKKPFYTECDQTLKEVTQRDFSNPNWTCL